MIRRIQPQSPMPVGLSVNPTRSTIGPVTANPVKPDDYQRSQASPGFAELAEATQRLKQELAEASTQFEQTWKSQGIIGSFWDGIKNTVGVSGKTERSWLNPAKWWSKVFDSDGGSRATGGRLVELKNRVVQLEEAVKSGNLEAAAGIFTAITGKPFQPETIRDVMAQPGGLLAQSEAVSGVTQYQESQKTGVDVLADLGSGIVAFAGYSMAVAGTIAAPFTLGSSLALTAWGVGIATAGGAVSKTLIKATDAFSGGRSYDSLPADLLTGGFSGLLAPVSAGVGAFTAKQAGSQLAKRLGIQGFEITVESLAKTAGQNGLKAMSTQIGMRGGSTLLRGAIRGTEWVTAGVFAGGLDNPFRHVVHTGSIEGVGQAFVDGVVGGAILSPAIGGGMHLAGKGAGFAISKALSKGNLDLHPTLLPKVHAEQLTKTPQQVQHLASHVDEGLRLLHAGNYQEALVHFGNAEAAQQAGFQLNLVDSTTPIPTSNRGVRGFIRQSADAHSFNPETSTITLQRVDLAQPGLSPKASQKIQRAQAFMAWEEWHHALQESVGGIPLSRKMQPHIETLGQHQLREVDIPCILQERGIQLPAEMVKRYNRQAFLNGEPVTLVPTEPRPVKTVTINGKQYKMTTAEPGTVYYAKPKKAPEDAAFLKDNKPLDFAKKPMQDAFQDSAQRQRIAKGVYTQAQNDPELARALQNRGVDFADLFFNSEFLAANDTLRFKKGVSTGGVSIGKMCQIMADDTSLPADLRAKMASVKSDGIVSRTLGQAQTLSDQLYGPQYQLQKSLGVGTVGETWLAKNVDDHFRVIKMIKEGVSAERLEEERLIWKAFIKSAYEQDAAARDKALLTTDRLFDGWLTELDFSAEKIGADRLGKDAVRYQVAPAEMVGLNAQRKGISIVYEMAPGLPLEHICDMLKVYRANPAEYHAQFADRIKQYPWLATPDEWVHKLPQGYLGAQNEQTLFLRSGADRTSHGDPHSGNVFVNVENGQPKWTYIDTGLTVTRPNAQAVKQLGMFTDLMLGNTHGLAKQIIESAESLPLMLDGKLATAKSLTAKLRNVLNERLYNSGVDYTNLEVVKRIIDNTLDEFGILQRSADAVFLKSQLQASMTYQELSRLAGQQNNLLQNSMGDIALGLANALVKAPIQTSTQLLLSGVESMCHPVQSFTILRDFFRSTS